jgi:hypothetical protein
MQASIADFSGAKSPGVSRPKLETSAVIGRMRKGRRYKNAGRQRPDAFASVSTRIGRKEIE